MARIHPVTLPKWGLEMSEGTVATWRVAVGTHVPKGADLVDIETDKIVNTLDLDRAGTLRRQIAKEGDKLPVGALIAVLADPDVGDAEIEAFVAAYQPINASFEPHVTEPAPAASVAGPFRTATTASAPQAALPADELARRNAAAHASPIARRLADELGIDLSIVKGTGKGDRISQTDVEARATALGLALPNRDGAAIASVDAAPSSVLVPWSSMRRAIGQTLTTSKQTIPHFYISIDVMLDVALALRTRLNGSTSQARISFNDLVTKAVATALVQEPGVNAHVEADGVRQFSPVNIAQAVAIADGVLAPVLCNVAAKSVAIIAAENAQLFERARARTLIAADLQGATFTISNLGMFGIRAFDAVITPPQAAVLAIGATRREMRESADGDAAFASVATITLSADHRAIDGALAARFLNAVKDALERPATLEM